MTPQPPEPTGWLHADDHRVGELEAIARKLVDDLAMRLRVERDRGHATMIANGTPRPIVERILAEADHMHRQQLIEADVTIRRGIAERRGHR